MQWTIETPDGPRVLALRMPTQLEVLEFRGAQTEWPDHPGADATGKAQLRWLAAVMPTVQAFLRSLLPASEYDWLAAEVPSHVTLQLAFDVVAAREVPADTLGKFGVSRK